MFIDLSRLYNNIDSEIVIDTTINFPKQDLEKADLLDLKDLKVFGTIRKDALDSIVVNMNIAGTMVLECARTLKPVEYPLDIDVEVTEEEILEIDENFKKNQNMLDIFPIIWENVLMEVPMRVVSKDVESLEVNTKQETNSPFDKLKSIIEKEV